MTLHCETANHCTGSEDSFSQRISFFSHYIHTWSLVGVSSDIHTWSLVGVPFSEIKLLTFGDADRRPTASSPHSSSSLPKLKSVGPAKQSANALESGALQEMGKNQRCSHRTCGHCTFPITATKALSAQVRLGEMCRHFQRWWPLRPLHP